MKRLIFAFTTALLLSIVLTAQQTGTPSQIRVRVDSANTLMTTAVAQIPPISQPTLFTNTRLRTDSSGNLIVADASGAGFAPGNATYITQTPDAALTNEQALSLLGTGVLFNTTSTGVLSITQDPVFTGSVTVNRAGTGSTTNPGYVASASTAASLGVQQTSPTLKMIGNGWNNISNASHPAEFMFRVLPVQGNPITSSLTLFQQVNSGGYSTIGTWTNTGNYTSAGRVTGTVIDATSSYLANGSFMYLMTTPTITSGFSTTTPTIVGKASSFAVTIAATPGITGLVAFNGTFTNIPGVNCTNTVTANAIQTVPTTTNVVLNGIWIAGDVIRCIAIGY